MKNKRQTVNTLMAKFDHENGVIEYQILFSAFASYLNSEEVNEMPSKMQVAHFLESFLRKENIQDSLTLTEINGLMDEEYILANLNDIRLYQNILLLIYEELSSNDKEVSKFLLKIILNVSSKLINQFPLDDENSENNNLDNNYNETNEKSELNNEILFNTMIDQPNENQGFNPNMSPNPGFNPNMPPSPGFNTNMPNSENPEEHKPDCFNCDKKFICKKDTRDVELIEKLHKEDIENFSNLTKNVKVYSQKEESNDKDYVSNNNGIFDIEIKNSNRKYLKEYLMKKNIIPYECDICGLDSWQNNPLMLELDILDPNRTDIKNYRFLCPNCYSQVGSFK